MGDDWIEENLRKRKAVAKRDIKKPRKDEDDEDNTNQVR